MWKDLQECPSAWSLGNAEKYGFQQFETPRLFSKAKGVNNHSCMPVCLLDVPSEYWFQTSHIACSQYENSQNILNSGVVTLLKLILPLFTEHFYSKGPKSDLP